MKEITAPVTVDKSDLLPISALRGKVNREEVTIGDIIYPPETLVFLGFEGSGDKHRRFHGVFKFREVTNTDEENQRIPFSTIPYLVEEEEEGDAEAEITNAECGVQNAESGEVASCNPQSTICNLQSREEVNDGI